MAMNEWKATTGNSGQSTFSSIINANSMSFDPEKLLQEQQKALRSQSWILTKIHDFQSAHNRLKHTVHTAWRYPLPPWGRAVMGCVYFSIPVVVGYAVSNWVVSQSEATVEERFANVDKNAPIQGLGDKKLIRDETDGTIRTERVGAGGWGGGVHLTTSDPETQEMNRVNLERFLKKQRRLKEKREQREAPSHDPMKEQPAS